MPVSKTSAVEGKHVKSAYARWAPVYEVLASPTVPARKVAAKRVNAIGGRFLEAGVGSGSALSLYGDNVTLVGVDLSHDMLKIARQRASKLPNVEAIAEMDLMTLGLPDNAFDGVVCMFTMTAVPDPVQVLSEFARVTRPGGTILVASHFEAKSGPWWVTDKLLGPFGKNLGWNPSLPVEGLLTVPGLTLVGNEPLPPMGMITLLTYAKAG